MSGMNPDCQDGKHRACSGDAWDFDKDERTVCSCPCHREDMNAFVRDSDGQSSRAAAKKADLDIVPRKNGPKHRMAHASMEAGTWMTAEALVRATGLPFRKSIWHRVYDLHNHHHWLDMREVKGEANEYLLNEAGRRGLRKLGEPTALDPYVPCEACGR